MTGDVQLGWRCWWQDFTGWRERYANEPIPPKRFLDFTERADAERELRLQKAAGRVATITPVPIPRARVLKARKARQMDCKAEWPLQARIIASE